MARGCDKCGGRLYLFERAGEFARARVCDCSAPESCAQCGGNGVTYAVVEKAFCEKVGPKRYEVAQQCACRVVAARVAKFNEAGLPAVLSGAGFDAYRGYSPEQERAKEIARNLAFSYKRGGAQHGFVLSGPPGTGKTHLLVAALSQLVLESGVEARYVEMSLLYQEIRRGFSEGKNSREIVEPLAKVEVVALDELGKGRGSPFELETLDELIARRYNAGLTTLFATNYSLAYEKKSPVRAQDGAIDWKGTAKEPDRLLERIGDRIFSRLMEMTEFVSLPAAKDVRQAKHEARPRR